MSKHNGHTVKAAGKKSYDSRQNGQGKPVKIATQVAQSAGKAMTYDRRKP